MNRRGFFMVAVLLLSGTAYTNAQQKKYVGDVSVVPYEVSQRGDSLVVGMKIDMNGLKVDSRRSLELIPVVKSDGGEKELPSVMICGRNRYKAYKRELALFGSKRSLLESEHYATLRSGKKSGTVNYHYVVPFESWMKDAHLDLKEDMCGCAGATQQITVERLADNISLEKVLVPYEIMPNVAYIRPEVEVNKQRAVSKEAYLNFLSGQSKILPSFGNNQAELEKINQLIESVKDDKDIKIKQIIIAGYASPEGTLKQNEILSDARATALRNYLTEHYNLSKDVYKIAFGGEDWEGLVKKVEASDMPYKQEVLDIINSVSIEAGRETKLMLLKKGDPYRYMLKEMFPGLRRVNVTVDYEVKSFDLSEAIKVFESKPQNLSLEEMYQVANSYDSDSEAFRNVFETAVRMFPKDDVANLNAAAAALARKDVVSAEKYLNQVRSKVRMPESENSRGVLLMLKGDYTGAEQWLKQAENAGVKAATQNLQELAKKKENAAALNAVNK